MSEINTVPTKGWKSTCAAMQDTYLLGIEIGSSCQLINNGRWMDGLPYILVLRE
jgi:hypothetical protein